MHVWDKGELKANDNKACAVIFLFFLRAQKRKEISLCLLSQELLHLL